MLRVWCALVERSTVPMMVGWKRFGTPASSGVSARRVLRRQRQGAGETETGMAGKSSSELRVNERTEDQPIALGNDIDQANLGAGGGFADVDDADLCAIDVLGEIDRSQLQSANSCA